jgi:crotonobetainyl-CoA:carnitine CoA-transferase CaiB-like acyl-CoA transferase
MASVIVTIVRCSVLLTHEQPLLICDLLPLLIRETLPVTERDPRGPDRAVVFHPAPASRGPGPLDGITVLDMSRVLSGPHCSRMLCDLGADVIKVEPPEGDMTRYAHPRINSLSTYFVQQNIGKRNISLDLRRPEAVELVARLAERADVLLENFRPGVMERMGLGFDRLSARNPRLVYARISGFGQSGPWRDRRAYAPIVQAEMGFTKAQVDAHRRRGVDIPYVTDEHSHGDLYTGLEATVAICAALVRRSVTGSGQAIDIAMGQTMLCVNEHMHNYLWDGHREPGRVDSFRPGDNLIVTVGDGTPVVLAGHPVETGNFALLAKAMGRPELGTEDPRFADPASRLANLAALAALLQEWAASVPDATSFVDICDAAGVLTGVLRSARDAARTDWAVEREGVVTVSDRGGGAIAIPNTPWRFSAADSGVRGEPRYRGEDNRAVLGGLLGLDDGELDRLEREGVLSSRIPDGVRP